MQSIISVCKFVISHEKAKTHASIAVKELEQTVYELKQ